MKNSFDHTNFEKEFFTKTNIRYSKSKKEVWSELEAKLEAPIKGKAIKVNFKKVFSYSAAAVLVIGLGIYSFLRFYTINIYCPNGQHSSVKLPDGSKVSLNAGSELAYHPYWWKYNREVDFNGEAFFEVTKGETFTVVSETGITTVLGTSFNIFARNKDYRVHCITGKVRVEVENKKPVVLTKNEYSLISKKQGFIIAKDTVSSKNSIAWLKNEFKFKAVELKIVLEEIERQFDVVIEGKNGLTELRTIDFNRGSSLDSILNDIVGKPSGIKFENISNNRYRVKK